MSVTVKKVRVNQSALRTGMSEGGVKFCTKHGRRVLTYCRVEAPVQDGRLRQSLDLRIRSRGGSAMTAVITARVKYAVFVHEGTGIYGPSGRMITPKKGKFLVWRSRAGGKQLIFAKKVKGQKPNPFMVRGLRRAFPAQYVRLLNTRAR